VKPKYFKLAKKLSLKSDHKQHRLGCVIVKGNDILGIGFNKNRTHPKSMSAFKTLHAEVAAVVNAGEDEVTGATAYVYRQTVAGNMALAKPCAGCEALLRLYGVVKVCYSTASGYVEEDYYG
jgi:deoxycytidylate deaminase